MSSCRKPSRLRQDTEEWLVGVSGAASSMNTSRSSGTNRWEGRPWLARGVRALVVIVPFVLSVASAYLLAKAVPPASSTLLVVARFVLVAATATVVMRAADRLMRRALPLAALLDLTLIFPDQAPSRYRMALRNGASNIELQELVDRYVRTGRGDTAAAAEHLLDLVAALSRHDRITRGHSERVRAYAQMIGEEMGLAAHEIDRLRWAALIHDVGKLRIPTEILNKPGKLTDEEYEIIKRHPEFGAELARPLADWLGDGVLAVVQHHEKWDGSGYPYGLRGTEISQAGRIVAVADVFDVLTSVRSYKNACSPTEARAELTRCAGSHFDPAVVRAFMNLSIGRLRKVMGPLSWIAQLSLFPQLLLRPAAGPAMASPAPGGAGTGGAGSGGAGASTAGASTAGASSTGLAAGASSVASAAASGVASVAGVAGSAILGVVAGGMGAVALADRPAPEPPPAVVETVDVTESTDQILTDVEAGRAQLELAPLPPATTTTTPPDTTTTAPPDTTTTAPPDTTTTAPPDTTTTTPPATTTGKPPATTTITAPPTAPITTTTKVPDTTTTTTTTVPDTTTTTTVPDTTTTTTVPDTTTTTTVPPSTVTSARYLLAAPVKGDQPSREVLPLVTRTKALHTNLPNYDTDRDTLTGLLIRRGGALAPGDPARMQRFALDSPGQVTYRGRAQVDLNVAKSDPAATSTVDVVVALAVCSDTTPDCTVVSTATRSIVLTGRSIAQDRYLDLGAIDVTVAPEQRLELWVAAGAASQEDLVLVYDATGLRSRLLIDA
jgi:HD-GYP domain-containing protein (c-di-GMP phosphodiesterase class II)